MSKVYDVSTMIDLYAEVRYINEELTTDDRMQPLSWARVQELQERKRELIEEIDRINNERFR